jgi:hypothetical protein
VDAVHAVAEVHQAALQLLVNGITGNATVQHFCWSQWWPELLCTLTQVRDSTSFTYATILLYNLVVNSYARLRQLGSETSGQGLIAIYVRWLLQPCHESVADAPEWIAFLLQALIGVGCFDSLMTSLNGAPKPATYVLCWFRARSYRGKCSATRVLTTETRRSGRRVPLWKR